MRRIRWWGWLIIAVLAVAAWRAAVIYISPPEWLWWAVWSPFFLGVPLIIIAGVWQRFGHILSRMFLASVAGGLPGGWATRDLKPLLAPVVMAILILILKVSSLWPDYLKWGGIEWLLVPIALGLGVIFVSSRRTGWAVTAVVAVIVGYPMILRPLAISAFWSPTCLDQEALYDNPDGITECFDDEDVENAKREEVAKIVAARRGVELPSLSTAKAEATPPAAATPAVDPVEYEPGNCPFDKKPGTVYRTPLTSKWLEKPYGIEGCDVRVQTDGPVKFKDGEVEWDYDPSNPEELAFVHEVSVNAKATTGKRTTLWRLYCDQGYLPKPGPDGDTPWECALKRVGGVGTVAEATHRVGLYGGVELN